MATHGAKRTKRIFFLVGVMTLSFAAPAAAGGAGEERELSFQRHDSSYFEKNNSGLRGEKSYLVLSDQQQFDRVFDPAVRMGANALPPRGAFDNMIVVAAIKRGTLRRYGGVAVTEENGVLLDSYTAADDRPGAPPTGSRSSSPSRGAHSAGSSLWRTARGSRSSASEPVRPPAVTRGEI